MSPHEHAGHEHAGHAHDEHDHDELDACIEACLQCHVVCTMTAQYCLRLQCIQLPQPENYFSVQDTGSQFTAGCTNQRYLSFGQPPSGQIN